MDSDTTDVIELEDLEEKEETDGIQKSKNRRLQYRSTAVSFAEDVTERRYLQFLVIVIILIFLFYLF